MLQLDHAAQLDQQQVLLQTTPLCSALNADEHYAHASNFILFQSKAFSISHHY